MAKIKSLTKEQKKSLHVYRDEIALNGYSTQPADRKASEAAFHFMYKAIKKKLKRVIWLDSPRQAYILSIVAKHSKKTFKTEKEFYTEAKNLIAAGKKGEFCWTRGQHEWWTAFFSWPEKEGLVKYNKKDSKLLEQWVILQRSCGWWWPREAQVWACERPEICKVDEAGLLHSENGPAFRFRDGWEIYSWHGMTVPKEWIIDKENVDPTLALTHPNMELRRALAEIIGWGKVLQQLDCKLVAEDRYGILIETNLPNAGRTKFVHVRCATSPEGWEITPDKPLSLNGKRIFVIPVPNNISTALEGVAWTAQMTPEEYAKLEVRT